MPCLLLSQDLSLIHPADEKQVQEAGSRACFSTEGHKLKAEQGSAVLGYVYIKRAYQFEVTLKDCKKASSVG